MIPVPVPAGFDRSSSGSGRIQNSGSGRSLPPPEAFCTPFFLRRLIAKLREIFTVFRYKNSKFGKNAPP